MDEIKVFVDNTFKKISSMDVMCAMEHDDIRYSENYGNTIDRDAISEMISIILVEKKMRLVDKHIVSNFFKEHKEQYEEEIFVWDDIYDYAIDLFISRFMKGYKTI
jgi:transposase